LQPARPLVLRSAFQAERPPRDVLGLASLVDAQLRDVSARGAVSPLIFVDAGDLPDAHSISGRYTIDDARVTVTFGVYRGETEVGETTLTGDRNQLADLAERIVAEASRLVIESP
jgi:hypothetical protein